MNQKQVKSGRSHSFRQWTRKPYAAFNSLQMVLKISVMSVAYTIVNPTVNAHAQADTANIKKSVELDEVEIGGQRTPVVNSQLSRVVTVITQKEIERAPGQSINDHLRNLPQVDLRQRGANGIQADLSIQGGTYDQTVILLNGINLNNPQTGHLNLNLPIDIESVDRIEVLKGTSSRVYGANAFSGAVNFVTGTDTSNYAKASAIAGDWGLMRTSVSFNQSNKKFSNFVSLTQGRSDGYIRNTNYDFKNAYYNGKAKVGNNTAGLQLGYMSKDYGSNNFYSPKYADQYEYNTSYFGALNGDFNLGILKLTPTVSWNRNYDHYILNKTTPLTYQNFHFTDVGGAGLNTVLSSSLGKTAIGIDYRAEQLYSTNLGTTMARTLKIPGENSIRYNKSDSRNYLNGYIEQNLTYGNFSASVGMLIFYCNKLSYAKVFPGIDMSYKVAKPIKLYVSLNQGLRMPTYTDLYYKGPINRGNPNLKPEEAITAEGGIKFQAKGIVGNVSYFNRWGTNVIDWVRYPNSDSTVWTTKNYTKLDTRGVEFYVKINPSELLSINDFKNTVIISYSYTELSKKESFYISNYVFDYLKHKASIALNQEIYKGLGLTCRFTWQQRNGSYVFYVPAVTTSTTSSSKTVASNITTTLTTTAVTTIQAESNITKNYPAVALFDAKLYYNFKNVKLFTEVSNVFDKNYYDLGNITQPGRWAKVGVEFKLNTGKF